MHGFTHEHEEPHAHIAYRTWAGLCEVRVSDGPDKNEKLAWLKGHGYHVVKVTEHKPAGDTAEGEKGA